MTRSPIPRVLSTFSKRRVRALLMGGQACILYGAAEFSRDVDFSVTADPANLDRLRRALRDLRADPIFFPPLDPAALARGHACHFRCRAAGVAGLRIDVMGVMRNAAPFDRLWARRRPFPVPGAGSVAVMALPDLVRVKKTQRDKHWPMVRRLVEADVARARGRGAPSRVRFWLEECRTPGLLIALAADHPAVREALRGSVRAVDRELAREERRERELDARYWAPLKAELVRWRLNRPRP